jgi:hypothetical protein
MSLLVTVGISSDPSLSHVIMGSGFPSNSQVRVTLACSRTAVETGLDRIETPTERKGGREGRMVGKKGGGMEGGREERREEECS